MSEQRLDRLDRAVFRLMQAQQDALQTCEGVLVEKETLEEPTNQLSAWPLTIDAPRPPVEEGGLYRAALEGVRAILRSASEDVQTILGEGNGNGE
jgi:hypothetical protein